MRKAVIIIVSVILGLLLLALLAFGVFAYKNTHWFSAYDRALKKAGAVEKQVTTPGGSVINYGEAANDKPALLLIHGQSVAWGDYALIMPELSKSWHIYAVDVYGHGQSSHDEELYYIDVNGDDLIWFIDNVIGEKTVVAGHSNGALTAAYIAANVGENIAGVLLEDPPVFSTEGEGWEQSFAYLDTYRTIHEYNASDKSECWEAFYLRRCLWGRLYMADSMPKIADYAQSYRDKHPGEEVKIFFMPSSAVLSFHYAADYDLNYGEHFYDLSWNNGITHEELLKGINVPCVYLHAKESVSPDGTYLCAASREQAERAVGYIGDNAKLIETEDSSHAIHTAHSGLYIDALNSLLPER